MNIRHASDRFRFRSVKCRRAISFDSEVLRARLIQLSLDRSVDAIDQVDLALVGRAPAFARCVVAHRGGVGCVQHIGLPPATEGPPSLLRSAAEAQGFDFEIVDPNDVMAEPGLSAARAVWAQHGNRVDAGMTFALMAVLADEGPIRLGELCRLVRGPADPVLALASLACSGLVHLDLSRGFGPSTIVRA